MDDNRINLNVECLFLSETYDAHVFNDVCYFVFYEFFDICYVTRAYLDLQNYKLPEMLELERQFCLQKVV